MTDGYDRYWKLRPPPPVGEEELCRCPGSPPVMLQPHFSFNPLACVICNLEVAPEDIGFTEEFAEQLAFWQSFHDCFYKLWLDSGEYESWAKSQLEDRTSAVNTRGRELVEELTRFRPAYYWWFQDTVQDDFQPLENCPQCHSRLTGKYDWLVCESCKIVVAN